MFAEVEVSPDEVILVGVEDVAITVTVSGSPGPPGQGVPAGGSAGQVLTKTAAADYSTAWQSITPEITVGKTPPPSPAVDDIWVDTN